MSWINCSHVAVHGRQCFRADSGQNMRTRLTAHTSLPDSPVTAPEPRPPSQTGPAATTSVEVELGVWRGSEQPSLGLSQGSRIGSKTTFSGDFHLHGHLMVQGRVEGGIWQAGVRAGSVEVCKSGHVRGTISCSDVEIRGVVRADIQSLNLVVHDGAALSGRVRYGSLQLGDALLDAAFFSPNAR